MPEPLLTIVPARGGSKGLPGKNSKQLGDAPLLAWSYLAWREAGLPGQCWLSTEDEDLVRIGREVGMNVPFARPAILATDSATTIDVALHALDHYSTQFGGDPSWLLILQPTSPLRPPSVLREAWSRAISDDDLDGVVGVKAIYRSLSTLFDFDENGFIHPLSDAGKESRRQDARPLMTPNGALYLLRASALRREKTSVPKQTIGIVMNSIISIDIDDASDWTLAASIVDCGFAWR